MGIKRLRNSILIHQTTHRSDLQEKHTTNLLTTNTTLRNQYHHNYRITAIKPQAMDQEQERPGPPEWDYCAKDTGKEFQKVNFNHLYVKVQRGDAEATEVTEVLQYLEDNPGRYPQNSAMRFSFDSLKTLIGQDKDRFELCFQAWESLGDVAIPNAVSFRRLLVAIDHLGLPVQKKADRPQDYPLVLRFIAKPKDALQGDVIQEPPQISEPPRLVVSGPPEEDKTNEPQRSPSSIDNSFLPEPEGTEEEEAEEVENEEELTIEDRIEQFDLNSGFSNQEDVHEERFHDLYAAIAGINRNKRDPSNPNDAYRPPYATIDLPPHQTYPTGWVLGDSSRILHYLADKPGLGKTYEAVELMVRITMILSNGIAIENERAQFDSLRQRPLHMHEEEHPRFGRNTSCRAGTTAKYGFVCQCDPNSPLRRIDFEDFSEGFMLVLVPLHVVSQWFDEIKEFIRSSTRLPHNQKPFEIVNTHDDERGPGEGLKSFIYGNREHRGLGSICIAPVTTAVTSSLNALRERPRRELRQQPSIIVWDEVQTVRSKDHQSVQLVHKLIREAELPVHVLALSGSPMMNGPSDFSIVESIAVHTSMKPWFTAEVYDGYTARLQQARTRLDEYAKNVAKSVVGRGKRGDLGDEEKTEAQNLLRSYDQRSREYASVLPLIQRKQLGNYLGNRIPQTQPKYEETEIIRCDLRMNDGQKALANQYKEYLRLRYHHRVRVWSSKPEGTRGPRPKIKEILFELDPRGASATAHSSKIDVSLCGFAPGLTARVRNRAADSQQFRSDEANMIFRNTNTAANQKQAARSSVWYDRSTSAFEQQLTGTSQKVLHPKIETICRIIDEMLADRELHTNRARRLGVLTKKMVICVPHAWQGLILYMYLSNRYQDRTFTFIGAKNTAAERVKLGEPFGRKTSVMNPADSRTSDPIALISTYNFIGTGLNLTRCNYVIATSPLASMTHQEQLFARVIRKGQYCTAHTYVLLDNGNPVDVTTFHRMQMRTALTVPEDELGSGLDFLLQGIDEFDDAVDTSNVSGEEDSGEEEGPVDEEGPVEEEAPVEEE